MRAMRIAMIGNAGSGKSTLARRLATVDHVPVLDLDTVAWEPGEVARPRSSAAARADVRSFCDSNEHWIVEGCYSSLVAVSLEYKPHLLFLDPGLEQCQNHCRNRPWEPHKYRSKVEQDEKLTFLLSWVAEYYVRDDDLSYLAHLALFQSYTGPKQHLLERPGRDFVLGSVTIEHDVRSQGL